MTPNASAAKARCPECDARIFFERAPDMGQLLACPECGTRLEVVRTSPIKLDWVYDESGSTGGGFGDENPFDKPTEDNYGSNGYESYDDDGDERW